MNGRSSGRSGGFRVIVAACLSFLPAAAAAQETRPGTPAELGPEGSPLLDLTVMLLAFLLAVGLAWFGARFLIRRMYGPGASGRGRIRVVERIPLEPRRTLYLVQAGEKLLLVGSTDRDIRVLGEFAAADLPAPAVPERRTFLDALRAATGRPKAP